MFNRYLSFIFFNLVLFLIVGCGDRVKKAKEPFRDSVQSDQEFLPYKFVPPCYPQRAAKRRIQGYCTIGYTVTTEGATKDHVVLDCPEKVFVRCSLNAAKKFLYKPRVENGALVEVYGVKNRFIYQIAN